MSDDGGYTYVMILVMVSTEYIPLFFQYPFANPCCCDVYFYLRIRYDVRIWYKDSFVFMIQIVNTTNNILDKLFALYIYIVGNVRRAFMKFFLLSLKLIIINCWNGEDSYRIHNNWKKNATNWNENRIIKKIWIHKYKHKYIFI